MPFSYFNPAALLQPYIRCYWSLKGGGAGPDTLYPDGCVDIIVNLGKRWVVQEKQVTLEQGPVYLGGALTEAICEQVPAGVNLLGVRFEPGCFEHFYLPHPLATVKNDCVQIGDHMLPPLQYLKDQPLAALNHFFVALLKPYSNTVKTAVDMIIQSGGAATLSAIAGQCYKSPRQTERIFKQSVGLTPGQFCRVMKFLHFQKLLNNKSPDETLLGIALDAGYYDHAHLTRTFKKITGTTPSQSQATL